MSANASGATAPRIPLAATGLSLGLFLAITYVLCIALGLAWRDAGAHETLLELLPGFIWLTWPSFFLGLAETFALGWYIALVFVPLFNLIAARSR